MGGSGGGGGYGSSSPYSGSGEGGQTGNPCDLAFSANVFSPVAAIVGQVVVGDDVSIVLQNNSIGVLVPRLGNTNSRLGTLAGIPELGDLIACIQQGNTYGGRITTIQGGNIEIAVWRIP
jgi:hypothetical protein